MDERGLVWMYGYNNDKEVVQTIIDPYVGARKDKLIKFGSNTKRCPKCGKRY